MKECEEGKCEEGKCEEGKCEGQYEEGWCGGKCEEGKCEEGQCEGGGVRRDSVRRDGVKGNSVWREGENPVCCTSGRKCPACRLCVTQSKLSTQHWPAMPWKYFSVRSHTRLSASETQHLVQQKSETASVSVS